MGLLNPTPSIVAVMGSQMIMKPYSCQQEAGLHHKYFNLNRNLCRLNKTFSFITCANYLKVQQTLYLIHL